MQPEITTIESMGLINIFLLPREWTKRSMLLREVIYENRGKKKNLERQALKQLRGSLQQMRLEEEVIGWRSLVVERYCETDFITDMGLKSHSSLTEFAGEVNTEISRNSEQTNKIAVEVNNFE